MAGDCGTKGRQTLSRRALLAAVPPTLFAPAALPLLSSRAAAQSTPDEASFPSSGIRLLRLNSFEIRVPDVGASRDFYQNLFGMPVQTRSGNGIGLRIGDGPQFMAIRALGEGEAPGITRIGYAVEDFDAERTQARLAAIGFEPVASPPPADAGVLHRMQTWIREPGEGRELYFSDDNGLIVQLSAAGYCGGGGVDGTACGPAETAPAGLIELTDINHFTVFLGNGAAANRFYQQTFGLEIQAYQGPQSPVTGIGDGRQFVMYAGRGDAGAVPANIHHGSFNMRDFDVEQVLDTLTSFGLSARGERDVGPLMHYVSRRMPERGGAEGGTPEVYFTDPDGILLQLQDRTYCGGGGYLGNECF